MRILVTNDDGITSPGLHELVRAIDSNGVEVTAAAPLEDCTGAGAGVGEGYRKGSVSFRRYEIPGAADVQAFGVDALPALIVLVGCLGGFGEPPDLVVSGINLGLNTGPAVLHSGTVGAALTALHFQTSALAVSVQPFEPVCWDTAAKLAARVINQMKDLPAASMVNLNVPGLPSDEVRGVRRADLCRRGPFRSPERSSAGNGPLGGLQVKEDGSGIGTVTLDLGWPTQLKRGSKNDAEFAQSERTSGFPSDTDLVDAGYAAVTVLTLVHEDSQPSAAVLLKNLEALQP